jgi:hypothetical protein
LARITRARRGWILNGRWDARQRVQEEPDEDLGPQQVHPAAGPGRLHGLSERGNPGHRGASLNSWQVVPGERRSTLLVRVQAYPCPPFGLLAPPFGRRRVNIDDRPA